MSIRDNFKKLKLFQKIELYLIVLMFYGAVFYFLDDMEFKTSNIVQTKDENIYNKQYKSLKTKISKKDNNLLIKILEEESNLLNIFIIKSKTTKAGITMVYSGKFTDSINYLNYIKNHFNIKSFDFKYEKHKLTTTMEISTQYFYNQNMIYYKLANIANPFTNNKQISPLVANKENKELNINEIISSHISINGKWYKKGSIIKNKKIVSVNSNSVELIDINKNNKYIIKVFND